jgi:hypothetical protein
MRISLYAEILYVNRCAYCDLATAIEKSVYNIHTFPGDIRYPLAVTEVFL